MTIGSKHPRLLYPELSYKIMNLIFEIHNQLGPGFTEDIYERALIVELERNGIPFECQKSIEVQYIGILVNFGNTKVQSVRIIH